MRVMVLGRVRIHKHVELLAQIDKYLARVDAFSCDHAEDFSENTRLSASVQMFLGDFRESCARSLTPHRRKEEFGTRSGTSWSTVSLWRTPGRARWTSAISMASTTKVTPNMILERSETGFAVVLGLRSAGPFLKRVRHEERQEEYGKRPDRKGPRGTGEGQKGSPGVRVHTWGGKSKQGSNFRFQGTCNFCGGWGHRQAECPSVAKTLAVEQAEGFAEHEAAPSAPMEPEALAVGGIWNIGDVGSPGSDRIPVQNQHAPLARGGVGRVDVRVSVGWVPDPRAAPESQ